MIKCLYRQKLKLDWLVLKKSYFFLAISSAAIVTTVIIADNIIPHGILSSFRWVVINVVDWVEYQMIKTIWIVEWKYIHK